MFRIRAGLNGVPKNSIHARRLPSGIQGPSVPSVITRRPSISVSLG